MNDPRQHVNEEPRHDAFDVATGMGFMSLIMIVSAVIMTFVSLK